MHYRANVKSSTKNISIQMSFVAALRFVIAYPGLTVWHWSQASERIKLKIMHKHQQKENKKLSYRSPIVVQLRTQSNKST